MILTFSALLDLDSAFDFRHCKNASSFQLLNSKNSKHGALLFCLVNIVAVIPFPIATSTSQRLVQVLRDIFVIGKMLQELEIIGTL